MASLQDFDALATLIEDAFSNRYTLGFSAESGVLDLQAYSFNSSMPRIHVKTTESADEILNILWDEAQGRKIIFNAGLQKVELKVLVENGAKVFKLVYVKHKRNCCITTEIEEAEFNTRLQAFVKTKRFKLLKNTIEEFTAKSHKYEPKFLNRA